jgi:hypothetical protein
MEGVLPAVTFHVCITGVLPIGDTPTRVYSCAATGSVFASVRTLAETQAGSVKLCARVVLQQDGTAAYTLPYDLVAIKKESKEKVGAQQARLRAGRHGDNSLLDKALTLYLAGTAARDRVARVLECWHDDANLYTVMPYMPMDMFTRVVSEPPAGQLPEGA